MLPLRKRLDRRVKETGHRLDVLQQDYLLSWALVGLYQHPLLRQSLVFKGGTALKKCYFGNYRFSEDLDFTLQGDIASKALSTAIKEAVQYAETRIREYAPLSLSVAEYKENEPHPFDQEAFQIRAQFPWQREPLTVVMIEISRDELLLLPSASRALLHDYSEPIEQAITVYSLEEIILEKLRAILQHTKKLHERDWNRSRARDFYDLWSIFNHFDSQLKLNNFHSLLSQKCSLKGVSFDNVDSFFNETILNNVSRTWTQWLGPLVADLPSYNIVIKQLRNKITTYF